MPNRAAKSKKQRRRKLNEDLRVFGRTSNQIARNSKRNEQRKGRTE